MAKWSDDPNLPDAPNHRPRGGQPQPWAPRWSTTTSSPKAVRAKLVDFEVVSHNLGPRGGPRGRSQPRARAQPRARRRSTTTSRRPQPRAPRRSTPTSGPDAVDRNLAGLCRLPTPKFLRARQVVAACSPPDIAGGRTRANENP